MNPEVSEFKYKPLTCKELVARYQEEENHPEGSLIRFNLGSNEYVGTLTQPITNDNQDNIAAEIIFNPAPINESMLVARVEPSEPESRIALFYRNGDIYEPIENMVRMNSQDPFYNDELDIFGDVEILETDEQGNVLNYQTHFYRFNKDIRNMESIAIGPPKMKDIRLVKLEEGKIGVFVRPQGEKYQEGKIGYFEIGSLDDLQAGLDSWEERADMLMDYFAEKEWGGINYATQLEDDRIGVIGHIAHFQDGKKNYYAFEAIYDPQTGEMSEAQIIAAASDLSPELGVKPIKKDLGLVTFPGGIYKNKERKTILVCGVADDCAAQFPLKKPLWNGLRPMSELESF
ncbi:MAG: hypothetical protein US94_C0001G0063 [Berkelbacteria bacterium GW2011_GWB1_38_5]|uniref:DUF1861 family protein n=2 Tax=Candidatus Berkelbacteria TaxID=1618330 RepID=A0A0G0NYC1_9BACT|nr:MAG: hypothetical protein US94_C0001G0063 [Berkelbacteria bacterium GW2011_GWB1_38_5]KKQ90834.1 MAG: hypothetical protein UT15_C0003G0009 [Berkelbacteria bacterium GW2011_GWA1_39_10]